MEGFTGFIVFLLVVAVVVLFAMLIRQGDVLRGLEQQLRFLQDRIFALEQRQRTDAPPEPTPSPAPPMHAFRQAETPPPPPAPPPAPIPAPPPPPVVQPVIEPEPIPAPMQAFRAQEEAHAAAPVAVQAPPAPPRGESLEQTIGRRWFVWAGVAALFISVVFLVQYAIANWLGPWGRVILGGAFGLALLLAGDRARRRGWRPLGEGLMGGGLAILYAALFAAYALYHLLSAPAAFAGMVMVTALGTAMAVRNDAPSLAVLAALGGFLTPVFINTGEDARDVLCTYLLLLDLGVMGVAVLKRWRGLDLLAFAGTWLLFLGWFRAYYTVAAVGPALAWLCTFALIFQVLPFFYHLRTRIAIPEERFLLALLNAGVAYAFAASMLYAPHRAWLALVALGFSAVNLGLGALTRRRVPHHALSVFGFILLSVAFLTLAVPLVLHGRWVLAAWAAEAPVLLALGYRYRYLPLRVGSALILLLAMLRLFVQHWPLHDSAAFTPVLNLAFLTALAVAASGGVMALIHAGQRAVRTEVDEGMQQLCAISGGLLATLLVQTELAQAVASSGHPEIKHYVSALVWAVGALLFVLSGLRASRMLMVGVGALLFITAGSFAAAMYGNGVAYLPFLNPRFGFGAVVLAFGYLAWKATLRREEAGGLRQLLFSEFELTAFLLITLEATRNVLPTWPASLLLTGVWAVYAAVLQARALLPAVDDRFRSWWLRAGSLLLLVLAVGRLLILHWPLHDQEAFRLIFNPPCLTALAVAAAAGVMAWLYTRQRAAREPADGALQTTYAIAGGLLATLTVQTELAQWLASIGHDSVQHYASALVWAVGALVFVLAGVRTARIAASWTGAGMLLVAGGFATTAALLANGTSYLPFLNPHAAFQAAVLACGLFAWWVAYRGKAPMALQQVLFGQFEVVSFLLISLEAVLNTPAGVADPAQARWLAQMLLTITWAVYAAALLGAGFWRRARGMRLAALVLFGIVAGKLLIFDLAVLEQIYRILAFFVTGLLMVGAGYLYQRLEQRLRDEGQGVSSE